MHHTTRAAIMIALIAPAAPALAGETVYKDFPPNPLEKPGYELVVHDEFSGPKLDTNLWITGYLVGTDDDTYEIPSNPTRYGFANVRGADCILLKAPVHAFIGILGGQDRTNYTVEAKVRLLASPDGRFGGDASRSDRAWIKTAAGLALRCTYKVTDESVDPGIFHPRMEGSLYAAVIAHDPDGSGYARLGYWDHTRGFKVLDEKPLAGPVEKDRDYALKAVCNGVDIELFVDGVSMLRHTLKNADGTKLLARGGAGVVSQYGVAMFDDVRISDGGTVLARDDFEDGDLAEWTFPNVSASPGHGTRTNVTHDGSRRMRVDYDLDAIARTCALQTLNLRDWHHTYKNRNIPTVNKFSELYGYYEVRSFHPVAKTARHAAWWMLEAKQGGGEIDIHEDDSFGSMNFHFKTGGSKPVPGLRPRKYNLRDTYKFFKIYGMEIVEDGIKFYENNELINYVLVDWKERGEVPFGHLLSMYPRFLNDDFFVIDYFRYYRRTPAADKAEAGKAAEP